MIDPLRPPRVSVVIPCWNEAPRLGAVLQAIRDQDVPPHEIIVVDSGSTDATIGIVRQFQRTDGCPIRLLTSPPRGPALAMNAGIAEASGDTIIRLDGHAVPRPDYIRRSVARLYDDRNGVVGGVWEIVPGADTVVARAIAAAMSHQLGTGGAAYRHPRAASDARAVDTVPYGCYRKTLWQELGGYDRRPLSEDYLFNYRTRLAGWRVVLDPSIRCTYYARPTFARLAAQYFKYGWHKAELLKHYPRAVRWRQIVPGTFVALPWILGVVGFFDRAAWVLAGAILAAYAVVATTAAVQIAVARRNVESLPALVTAFGVMHITWGMGACVNLIACGRWPYGQTSRGSRAGQAAAEVSKP